MGQPARLVQRPHERAGEVACYSGRIRALRDFVPRVPETRSTVIRALLLSALLAPLVLHGQLVVGVTEAGEGARGRVSVIRFRDVAEVSLAQGRVPSLPQEHLDKIFLKAQFCAAYVSCEPEFSRQSTEDSTFRIRDYCQPYLKIGFLCSRSEELRCMNKMRSGHEILPINVFREVRNNGNFYILDSLSAL